MKVTGSESGPEVCGFSELLVIWPVQSPFFSGSFSTSCPLKAQGQATWDNHMLIPQLPFEEEGTYYLSADLLECIYNAQLLDVLE